MADGINIEGGFDDLELTDSLNDGTIQGLLLDFAQTLQNDLARSAQSKGHYTAANTLIKDLQVSPKLIETDDVIIYALEMPDYGTYLDQGVSGTRRKFNSPFSYKESSGLPVKAMENYGRLKGALNLPDEKAVKRFGYLAARKIKLFGIKPSYWFSDVVTDGRIEDLEEEIGKRLAFVMIERMTT